MTENTNTHAGQKRVLIIEDEKPMARALELKLSHAGFVVQAVNDGQSGLDLLEKEHFDLVLLDLVMPKLDGFGVLEGMKKKNIKTHIIVQSNLSQEEDEKRVRDLGADEFFIKADTPIANIAALVTKLLSS